MIDIIIGCMRMGFVAEEEAELYKWAIENISSNFFLSDLSNEFLNGFHSVSSITLAIRNDGIVLPIGGISHFLLPGIV